MICWESWKRHLSVWHIWPKGECGKPNNTPLEEGLYIPTITHLLWFWWCFIFGFTPLSCFSKYVLSTLVSPFMISIISQGLCKAIAFSQRNINNNWWIDQMICFLLFGTPSWSKSFLLDIPSRNQTWHLKSCKAWVYSLGNPWSKWWICGCHVWWHRRVIHIHPIFLTSFMDIHHEISPWNPSSIPIQIYSGWWFQTFFIFHNIWDNPSHWLTFFKIVKTTNHYWFQQAMFPNHLPGDDWKVGELGRRLLARSALGAGGVSQRHQGRVRWSRGAAGRGSSESKGRALLERISRTSESEGLESDEFGEMTIIYHCIDIFIFTYGVFFHGIYYSILLIYLYI